MMKTLPQTLLVVTALFLGTNIKAQDDIVSVTDAFGNIVNSTTVHVDAGIEGDSVQILESDLNVQNVSGSTRTVNVKRYELNVQSGTENYFCWDVCYGAVFAGVRPSWTSLDPISMAAGFTATGFHAYYKPDLHEGVAIFRYVWYDVNDINDSAWVDLAFNAGTVGVSEVAGPVSNFTAYPNPSISGNITLDYDLGTVAAGTRLAIYNMLGERKLVRSIGAAQGRVVLSEGDLASGVWFAVLERNGHALATKRLVIAR